MPDLDATPCRVRPFLKWAGGKRQLLPQLRRFYPATFGAYFEPFVGSGAVFFDLHNQGLLHGHRVTLLDNCGDLIGCFLAIRNHVEPVLDELRRLAAERQLDPAAHYYEVRAMFNAARQALSRLPARSHGRRYPATLAAMFIYLNRTGFNGLFRLNARGDFNVPAGRYANPRIYDPDSLQRVSRALRSHEAQISCAHFSTVLAAARPGDFLYFDPPYAPLSATATFTSYTAGGFAAAAQRELQQVVIELAGRGCHVVVSNSTATLIDELYDRNDEARRVGLRAYRVPARRSINSNGSARGPVMEYVVTNVPPEVGSR